jgi:xylulose-5-phosphate/fructose-6-phosphate phosphoketolase
VSFSQHHSECRGPAALFKQFSFPAAFPATRRQTPGSINEGGELGYSMLHAHGAVFDNPDLIACCVVGDGEAETGTSRHQLALQQISESGAWMAR